MGVASFKQTNGVRHKLNKVNIKNITIAKEVSKIYEKIWLNIDDVIKAEGYLAHKWGLESSLPSDHVYKNSAP